MRLMCDSYLNRSKSLARPGSTYSLAQSGAPRRHARLPAHRARRPRFKHPPGVGLVKHRWEALNQNGELVLSMEGWGMFGRGHERENRFESQDSCADQEGGARRRAHPGKVVVVLDILFATTTMVTALAHGATKSSPCSTKRLHAPRASDTRMRARGRAPC